MDGLAARVGRAVMLDDPRLRLIAYSQTDDDVDPVRVRSILRRESPEDVRAWLFEHGLQELREPTVLAAVDELGMAERLCCPVRHEGALLGYLWVHGGAGDGVTAAALEAADRAGTVLFRRRLEEGRERAEDVAAIARAIHEEGGGPVAVVRTASLTGDLVDHQSALERALRRRSGGRGRCLLQEHDLLLAGAPADALVAALAHAALPAPTGLGVDLACGRRAAHLALLLARTGPLDLADVPLEAHLLQAAGDDPARVVVPPVVLPLLADDARQLRETVEAYLDCGGDVGATVAALHVSRAGLYRRLHRIEALVGVDLHDGPRRTLLHLGLKAARLRP